MPCSVRWVTQSDLTYSVRFVARRSANCSRAMAIRAGIPTMRRGLCLPPVGRFDLLIVAIVAVTAITCKQKLDRLGASGIVFGSTEGQLEI